MLRSGISTIGRGRRIAVLTSVCILATAGTLALAGTGSACSNATLKGTYAFGTVGWVISGGTTAPVSVAGFNQFNGAGTGTGVFTANINGVVVNSNTPSTLTYTINADCTGTVVANSAGRLTHLNVYVSPSGQGFSVIQTDPGNIIGTTATRLSVPE